MPAADAGARPGQARRALHRDASAGSRSARAPGSSTSRDDQFTAAASGTTTGLMQVFASGQGTERVARHRRGRPAGAVDLCVEHHHRPEERRSAHGDQLRHREGIRRRAAERPEPGARAAHRGASPRRHRSDDRLAACGCPATATRSSPQACQRTLAIFDGRMRYDLQLAFKRLDTVKAEKGYQGTVVVCSVVFRADRRAHPRARRDQISDRAARHRGVARADRRHARDGALPGLGPDPARARRAGGDAVRLDPAAGPDPAPRPSDDWSSPPAAKARATRRFTMQYGADPVRLPC